MRCGFAARVAKLFKGKLIFGVDGVSSRDVVTAFASRAF